jgi:hypothetical protein
MTSHPASGPSTVPRTSPRQPLRLALSPTPGRSPVDGAWWPQTRELDVELADLVEHWPDHMGSVYRALYSRSDWTSRPRTVATARRRIRTGTFPRDDTHLVVLSLSSRRTVGLLVVPPGHPEGESVMQWATHPLNRLTGAQILARGAEPEDDDDLTDQWNDTGGNWWQGSRAPSFRSDPTDPTEQTPPAEQPATDRSADRQVNT